MPLIHGIILYIFVIIYKIALEFLNLILEWFRFDKIMPHTLLQYNVSVLFSTVGMATKPKQKIIVNLIMKWWAWLFF